MPAFCDGPPAASWVIDELAAGDLAREAEPPVVDVAVGAQAVGDLAREVDRYRDRRRMAGHRGHEDADDAAAGVEQRPARGERFGDRR